MSPLPQATILRALFQGFFRNAVLNRAPGLDAVLQSKCLDARAGPVSLETLCLGCPAVSIEASKNRLRGEKRAHTIFVNHLPRFISDLGRQFTLDLQLKDNCVHIVCLLVCSLCGEPPRINKDGNEP